MTLKKILTSCDIYLKKISLVLCVLLPFFQLRGRAIADLSILFIAISFLLYCIFEKHYRCLLRGWFPYALGLWGVIVASSAINGSTHAVLEAIALLRYFVFAKALEEWLLDSTQKQQLLGLCVTLAGVWIICLCWEQYLVGVNPWGYPRWQDGALTGPFFKPRAGPPLAIIMFPGLMIYPMRMVQKKDLAQKLAGLALMSFLLLTMVMIGQRMPALLVFFGFFLCAMLIKTTRVMVLLATLSGFVALALLPFISPPSYDKLVLRFFEQLGHFSQSPYGQLYIRALNMVHAHPLLGLGYNGFRAHCGETTYVYGIPQFAHMVAGQDIGAGCTIHPHNTYLEIATTAGLSGLFLFVCMVLLWLKKLLLAALASRDLMQVMLFITVCMLFWPLASTSSLFTERTAGWVFLMVGWGLARARLLGRAHTPQAGA